MKASPVRDPAVHRTIVLIDVHRFSDPRRTPNDQRDIREGLYDALRRAFHAAGILWTDCYREDRGDGVFVLVPAHVPKEYVAAQLPTALAGEIARHNAASSAGARVQVRLALHAGEICYDTHGVSSPALIHAFRLLDAKGFKDELARSTAAVGVVVSAWFFDEVVQQIQSMSTVEFFHVRAHIKSTLVVGWATVVHAAPVVDGTVVHLVTPRRRTRGGRHRLPRRRGVRLFARILAMFRPQAAPAGPVRHREIAHPQRRAVSSGSVAR